MKMNLSRRFSQDECLSKNSDENLIVNTNNGIIKILTNIDVNVMLVRQLNRYLVSVAPADNVSGFGARGIEFQ